MATSIPWRLQIAVFILSFFFAVDDAYHHFQASSVFRRNSRICSTDVYDDFAGPTIVFVGNLPFDFDEASLLDLATSNGVSTGARARIEKNKKTGRSRGFGYLDMPSNADALNALKRLEGLEVEGRPLKLDLDAGTDTKSKGRRPPLTSEEFSLFLGNLPFSMAPEDVEHVVSTVVGELPMKVRLSYTLEGRSRGFAHVDFGSHEAVESAIAALNGFEVFDRELKAERALGRNQRGALVEAYAPSEGDPIVSKSVFVGNLPFDCSVEGLVGFMDEVLGAGVVKEVRLSTDRETGDFKGFGHVDFDTTTAAAAAVAKLNGVEFLGRSLRVDISGPRSSSGRGGSGQYGGRGGGGRGWMGGRSEGGGYGGGGGGGGGGDGGGRFDRGRGGRSSTEYGGGGRGRGAGGGGRGRSRDGGGSRGGDAWGDLGKPM